MASIMIAGSDLYVLDMLYEALEYQGFDVVAARYPEQAVRLAAAGSFDLIIVDPPMPGARLDVVRDFRRHPATAAVPILVLADRASVRAAALAMGAVECLEKPFGLAELRARVEALLVRRTAERHAGRNGSRPISAAGQ
jgi:DNA-binding response OmpR family regulator